MTLEHCSPRAQHDNSSAAAAAAAETLRIADFVEVGVASWSGLSRFSTGAL